MANDCLYCSAHDSSDEHVFSEALGCKEIIKEGVCSSCNNTFGHTFESKFVNGLSLFLNFFKIPNGQGVVPSVELKGKIGPEEFKFVVTGEGEAYIHPSRVRDETTASGHVKEFRLFHREDEQTVERNLQRKHSNLVWSRLHDKEITPFVFDAEAGFDGALLCSAEANRTIAKYALNLLIHEFRCDWVKDGFRSLIDYIKDAPSTARAGILWDPQLLKQFPFEPPKHLFVIVLDSKTASATVLIYLFCLFPYCVITETPKIVVDYSKSGALDPYIGRFMPLFLAGPQEILRYPSLPPFPMPEYKFSELLRRAEIGTLKQAVHAAKNAVGFMDAVYSAQPATPHICYNCQRILPQLTGRCQYCGESTVPSP